MIIKGGDKHTYDCKVSSRCETLRVRNSLPVQYEQIITYELAKTIILHKTQIHKTTQTHKLARNTQKPNTPHDYTLSPGCQTPQEEPDGGGWRVTHCLTYLHVVDSYRPGRARSPCYPEGEKLPQGGQVMRLTTVPWGQPGGGGDVEMTSRESRTRGYLNLGQLLTGSRAPRYFNPWGNHSNA